MYSITRDGTDEINITHKGVTLKIYNAVNTRKPTLIVQMCDKKKGTTLSIGLPKELANGISNLIQRRISEL